MKPDSCQGSGHRESGTVTAELAIGIPALLLVVSLVLGAIRWGIDAVSATSVAAETVRAIARGEDSGLALGAATGAVPTATWSLSQGRATAEGNGLEKSELDGFGSVCVTAILPPPVPLGEPIAIEQCAPR